MSLKWSQNNKITFVSDQTTTLDQLSEIVVLENPNSKSLVEAAILDKVQHVISGKIDSVDEHIERSLSFEAAPGNFFEFPLASILSPTSVNNEAEEKFTFYKKIFSMSSEKYETISEVEKSLTKAKVPSTILRDILLVVDEMFTNAIYNAPYDPKARPERGTEETLINQLPSSIILGGNDSKLCVVCRDPYGSLHAKQVLAQMIRCFDSQINQVIETSGSPGAGIGTYLMYMHSTSMYLGTRAGKESIVALVFQTAPRRLSRFNSPKSIHLINSRT